MGTLGLVSIVIGDEVVSKIYVTCNGFQAPVFAARLKEILDSSWNGHLTPAMDAAREVGFGCEDCLCGASKAVCDEPVWIPPDEAEEDFLRLVHTFQDPLFNPTWEHGTASYTEVVHVG